MDRCRYPGSYPVSVRASGSRERTVLAVRATGSRERTRARVPTFSVRSLGLREKALVYVQLRISLRVVLCASDHTTQTQKGY